MTAVLPVYALDEGALTITFRSREPYAASTTAIRFLKDRGFSVGPSQHPEPRGFVFGEVVIGKWRTIRPLEREALHGQVVGDPIDGPVRIIVYASAPDEARKALMTAPERSVEGPAASMLDRVIDVGVLVALALFVLPIAYVVLRPVVAAARHPVVGKIELRAGPIGPEAWR